MVRKDRQRQRRRYLGRRFGQGQPDRDGDRRRAVCRRPDGLHGPAIRARCGTACRPSISAARISSARRGLARQVRGRHGPGRSDRPGSATGSRPRAAATRHWRSSTAPACRRTSTTSSRPGWPPVRWTTPRRPRPRSPWPVTSPSASPRPIAPSGRPRRSSPWAKGQPHLLRLQPRGRRPGHGHVLRRHRTGVPPDLGGFTAAVSIVTWLIGLQLILTILTASLGQFSLANALKPPTAAAPPQADP